MRRLRFTLLVVLLTVVLPVATALVLVPWAWAPEERAPRVTQAERLSAPPRRDEATFAATRRPARALARAAPAADPYAGWRTWCEGPADPCTKDSDCAKDRTGRARRCVRPFWSKTEKVCAIPHPRRGEQELQKARVRMILDAQCGRRCDLERLWRFIAVVAARESGWRTWKQHRLNPDIVAARTSWSRARPKYAGNPHYATRTRWQGWGMLGQQSATFGWRHDQAAPPEILCKAPVAISTYLSCARGAFTKQSSLGIPPTWESVHWACSGGKVTPPGPSADFRNRAGQVGLDPTERIERIEWLGAPLGTTPQVRNATLAVLEADLVAAEEDELAPLVRCASQHGPRRWAKCVRMEPS